MELRILSIMLFQVMGLVAKRSSLIRPLKWNVRQSSLGTWLAKKICFLVNLKNVKLLWKNVPDTHRTGTTWTYEFIKAEEAIHSLKELGKFRIKLSHHKKYHTIYLPTIDHVEPLPSSVTNSDYFALGVYHTTTYKCSFI